MKTILFLFKIGYFQLCDLHIIYTKTMKEFNRVTHFSRSKKLRYLLHYWSDKCFPLNVQTVVNQVTLIYNDGNLNAAQNYSFLLVLNTTVCNPKVDSNYKNLYICTKPFSLNYLFIKCIVCSTKVKNEKNFGIIDCIYQNLNNMQ